jgi:hypothetical protein
MPPVGGIVPNFAVGVTSQSSPDHFPPAPLPPPHFGALALPPPATILSACSPP